MQEKKADNKIIQSKTQLDLLDDEIDQNKKVLKKFNDFQENTKNLQKSLNSCIELLEQSIKGDKANKMFSDMRDRNIHDCNSAMRSIDEKMLIYQKKISELNNKKDTIISEMRKEYIKEENKDKKEE